MSVIMTGNYIFVRQGERCFKVASNFTNYLELGVKGLTDYYLEGRVDRDEFVMNAALLDSSGKKVCEVVNNFPSGSGCRREMTPNGYRIISASGELLLGIEAAGNVCSLKGSIYDANGSVVARDEGDDFLIFRGPAVLGKSNGSLGIVLR